MLITVLLAAAMAAGNGAKCQLPVWSVVDGDRFVSPTVTLIGWLDGIHVWEATSFRLVDVRTPRRGEKGYQKARDDLESLIHGKLVSVSFPGGVPRRDEDGNFLVEVKACEPHEIDVNETMRQRGWALQN